MRNSFFDSSPTLTGERRTARIKGIMIAVVKSIDSSKIHLSDVKQYAPKRWYQFLLYDGKRLYIETPSFPSDGPRASPLNGVIHLPIPDTCVGEVLKVDEVAREKFVVPTTVPEAWREKARNGEPVYKSMGNAAEKHYFKFDDALLVFNSKREVIDQDEFGMGEYKCILHVKGIYIGGHGELDRFASLQCRIIQMMYTPAEEYADGCLFSHSPELPELDVGMRPTDDNTAQPPPPPPPSSSKASRPKLLRLNATGTSGRKRKSKTSEPNPKAKMLMVKYQSAKQDEHPEIAKEPCEMLGDEWMKKYYDEFVNTSDV